jgi:HD-GYP domain-containing protein (c-di-GMP phosphodiesterase class II)
MRELKESLVEMERGAGTQFDPNILRTFIETVGKESFNGLGSPEEPTSYKNGNGTIGVGGFSL